MQVYLNSTTSRLPFKAPLKENRTNYTLKYSQVPFCASMQSKKNESILNSLQQKLTALCSNLKPSKAETYSLDCNNRFSPETIIDCDAIQTMSEMCALDPFENLFIMNVANIGENPIIIFNSFFIDENGKEVMQMCVLRSKSSRLTSEQKAAYKIFYDDKTRKMLQKPGYNNPLAKLDSSNKNIDRELKQIAKSIENPIWDEYCAQAQEIDPVIFSADGNKKFWFNPKNI